MNEQRFLFEVTNDGADGDRRWTRDDAAMGYALLLGKERVDWSRVNAAIIDRWSLNALGYIKNAAWKMYVGR